MLAIAVVMLLALSPGAAYGGWWRYLGPDLVSASPAGDPGDGSSRGISISYDGRCVAFDSRASNLSPDDQNTFYDGERDVFVRDTIASTTYLASKTPSGALEPDRGARSSAMSKCGRYVGIYTGCDMVPEDTNGEQDVYLRDMATEEYTLLDPLGDGPPMGDNVDEIRISGDGQFVTIEVRWDGILPGDTNGRTDVYGWSVATDQFVWVSETPTSALETDCGARCAGVSDDGRYVGIYTGRDMVPEDTNGEQDLNIRDMETGEYTYADITGDGSSPGDRLEDMQMTGDGAFVVFTTDVDLVPDDGNGRSDVYVWSVIDERLIWASETPETALSPDRGARSGTISDDGMLVAFFSGRDHVEDDTNDAQDVYVRDMATGKFERVIVTADGSSPGSEIYDLSLSGDGDWLAFSWEQGRDIRSLGAAYYDPAGTGDVSPAEAISD